MCGVLPEKSLDIVASFREKETVSRREGQGMTSFSFFFDQVGMRKSLSIFYVIPRDILSHPIPSDYSPNKLELKNALDGLMIACSKGVYLPPAGP